MKSSQSLTKIDFANKDISSFNNFISTDNECFNPSNLSNNTPSLSHHLHFLQDKNSILGSIMDIQNMDNDINSHSPNETDNNLKIKLFSNASKHCLFCYLPLATNLSNIYISDDMSKTICLKHLPCQAISQTNPCCIECGEMLTNGKFNYQDSFLDFCGLQCLEIFLPKLAINCFLCNKILLKESFGQFCLKLENKSIRQFCSDECLEKFNPLAHYCYHCHKDLTNAKDHPLEFNLLPLNFQNDLSNLRLEDMQTEYFCNQNCLTSFESMQNAKVQQTECGYCEIADCSICFKSNQPVFQSFVIPFNEELHGTSLAQVCSEKCVKDFLNLNRAQFSKPHSKQNEISSSGPSCCEYCGNAISGLSSMTVLTIQGKSHFFCQGNSCAQNFKDEQLSIYNKDSGKTNNEIHECFWCKTKHFKSEMISIDPPTTQTNNNNKELPNYFCSKNCVRLFQMNQEGVGDPLIFTMNSLLNTTENGDLNYLDDISDTNDISNQQSKQGDMLCDNCNKVINKVGMARSQFYYQPTAKEQQENDSEENGSRKEFCSFPCMAQYKIALHAKNGNVGDNVEGNTTLPFQSPTTIQQQQQQHLGDIKLGRGSYNGSNNDHPSRISTNRWYSRGRMRTRGTRGSLLSTRSASFHIKRRRGRPSKLHTMAYNNINSNNSINVSDTPYRPPNYITSSSKKYNDMYKMNTKFINKIDQGIDNAEDDDKSCLNNILSSSSSSPSFKVLMDILNKTNKNNNLSQSKTMATQYNIDPINNNTNDNGLNERMNTLPNYYLKQHVVWPHSPKDVKNKSTSVKPLLRSQGTCTDGKIGDDNTPYHSYSSKIHPESFVDNSTQTDDSVSPKKIVPIPIPIPFYVPVPLHAYTSFTPVGIGMPVPIILPLFIPTTVKQTQDIDSYFQQIKDKANAAIQKEMLTLAETVAESEQMNPDIIIPEDVEARLKPLKGTPGYINQENNNTDETMVSKPGINKFHKIIQHTSLAGLGLGIPADMTMQQFINTDVGADSGEVGDAMQTPNQTNLLSNNNNTSLEDLYNQIASSGGILSITTTNGEQIAVLPIQNADGSITYASIDTTNGTLTPIDSSALQRQLLQLQLAAAATQMQQPQSQDQNSILATSLEGGGGGGSGHVQHISQQTINYTRDDNNIINTDESMNDLNSSNPNKPHNMFSETTYLLNQDDGSVDNSNIMTSQIQDSRISSAISQSGSVDELVNKWALIDFSPPYTFTLDASTNTKHLESAFGVGAFKFWVRAKNIIIAKSQIAANATSSNVEELKLQLLQEDPAQMPMTDLVNYLTLFVQEIRKPDGNTYNSDSIYYFCLGIQSYLNENGRMNDTIFADVLYDSFTNSLNEVLLRFEPQITAEGILLSRIDEECLWESLTLGSDSPHILINTLLYFNTKYFHLTTLEAHMSLTFNHIVIIYKSASTSLTSHENSNTTSSSNIDVQQNDHVPYLRYYPRGQSSSLMPTDGGGDDSQYVDIESNPKEPTRCPVRLYEFYLSKCPDESKNRNDVFYLLPEKVSGQLDSLRIWFQNQNLIADILAKMFNRIFIVKETLESNITV